jgi:adenylosuccinate synthase
MPNKIIVGAQWGDEGKAKIVDYLTDESQVVVRYQGGANAGHTVKVKDLKFIFHLIPAGILRPEKSCVIGNGVVLDPEQLHKEIEELKGIGISVTGRLWVDTRAHVVMPYHKQLDQAQESKAGQGKIGTTGRGIGPAYADKTSRSGIRAGDLRDAARLREKLGKILVEKNEIFTKIYNLPPLQLEPILKECLAYARMLVPFLRDTSHFLNQKMREGASLLFEGAQGTMLDVDHGTFPFVTSSNTVAGGACTGAGVGPSRIDEVIGIIKAYTTRVGNGPFPTELTGPEGEFIRKQGAEYGATTGRPRRCGWLDTVVIRKSAELNGLDSLAMTKIDVLDEMPSIKICHRYALAGEELDGFPDNTESLDLVEPLYEELPGWKTSLAEINTWGKLPAAARRYIERVEELSGVPIRIISVGAERSQTIVR